jgi:hypothetical protein
MYFNETKSEIEFSGIKFNSSLLKNIQKANFYQVNDSHIYILNNKILKYLISLYLVSSKI